MVTHMHKTYGPLTRHDTAQKSAQVHTRNIDIGEGRRRRERQRESVETTSSARQGYLHTNTSNLDYRTLDYIEFAEPTLLRNYQRDRHSLVELA